MEIMITVNKQMKEISIGVLCEVEFLVPSHSLPGPSISSFQFKSLKCFIY